MYREGKVKRTLERELKVPEIAKREVDETHAAGRDCCGTSRHFCTLIPAQAGLRGGDCREDPQ